ncbi:Uncharacterised protein [Mycobacteroides abscessus subsp. abscessus]|nr:Uncharacterised protein [Mycobacteroides abscessus subsp. abscessus]
MFRADRQSHHVPAALHRFPRPGLGPTLLLTQRLDHTRQLRDGGDIDDQDAAGHQRFGHCGQSFPGRQHVEDHAIDAAGVRRSLGEIADHQVPVVRPLPEERCDVTHSVFGVILTNLVGDHCSLRPHCSQQRTGERPGSGAGLQHPGAREDVTVVHDLRGVFRVDHLSTARHRQHIVEQQRTQHQKLVAVGGFHHAALGYTDHLVVHDGPTMCVELLAGLEHHRVVTPLGVGQLHAIADDERSGSRHALTLPGAHRPTRMGQVSRVEQG